MMMSELKIVMRITIVILSMCVILGWLLAKSQQAIRAAKDERVRMEVNHVK
jgi:hypothetical protein